MTPNTRKPTNKQVKDEENLWWWHSKSSPHPYWFVGNGFFARLQWDKGDRWLPYSAIPDPNNTTKEQTT